MILPSVELKVVAAVAALSAVLVAGFFVYHKGYSHASTLHERNAAQRETALLEQVTKAQSKLLEVERQHAAAVATIQADYERRAQEQAQADAAVIADLRNARERVRVKVAACPNPSVPATPATAGSANGTRTAELDPEVAARIWAIAADGERAVRKLIALQAWALKAVELCK